jgi:uncharacterized protein YbjT (DUF2867 family)
MTSVVLLTGATGFVGRQVLIALTEMGVNVRLVIREGSESQLVNFDVVEKIFTSKDVFAEDATWWADRCSGIDI